MWSDTAFVADFIELYKSYECLWKVKSPDYMNKIKKAEAYNVLLDFCKANGVEISVDGIKYKINNLRSSFRKELKKIHESQRSGATSHDLYVPKLWYFKRLQFLKEQDADDEFHQDLNEVDKETFT